MPTNDRLQKIAWPLLLGGILLLLLQTGWLQRACGLTTLQIPLPSTIGKAIVSILPEMGHDLATTLTPALAGLLIGAACGYVIALFIHTCPIAGFGCQVLMTMCNALPIVALAPLMNRWFPASVISKLVVIAIAAMGIMAIQVARGLAGIPKDQHTLFRALAATGATTRRKLQIPASLPAVFTAFKLCVPSAMLATIICEFFASETSGMGYMIKHSLKMGNHKQEGWAYIVLLCAISLLLYGLVCLLERKVIAYHASQRVAQQSL